MEHGILVTLVLVSSTMGKGCMSTRPTPGKQRLLVLWTKRKDGIHMSHASTCKKNVNSREGYNDGLPSISPPKLGRNNTSARGHLQPYSCPALYSFPSHLWRPMGDNPGSDIKHVRSSRGSYDSEVGHRSSTWSH